MVIGRLATEAEDSNSDGDGEEADPDEPGISEAEFIEQIGRLFRAKAKCLEHRLDAVTKMRAEHRHGDDVEKDSGPPGEAIDDHLPCVGSHYEFSLAIDFFEVMRGAGVGVADLGGEVKQVIDDESKDREAAPDHQA